LNRDRKRKLAADISTTGSQNFCLIESRRCGAIKANSIERNTMLWTIIVILVVLWLLGFIGHVGGGLIHLLLVIAVIIVIINLIQGRRGL
jgi:hypothetical protein